MTASDFAASCLAAACITWQMWWNNSGNVEPLSSHTNYLGVRGEYDLLFEPELLPSLTFFTGIGTRVWNRDLPDDFTASGTFVAGYQEFWWTVYPYLGMETRRDLHKGIEFYSMECLGLTAITLERAFDQRRGVVSPARPHRPTRSGRARQTRIRIGVHRSLQLATIGRIRRLAATPLDAIYGGTANGVQLLTMCC